MAFPRSLDTKAMSEFVIRRFLWDRWGKAFPPSPLPKDFRSLCPNFDLAMAIFYAMLLNEAEKLGVLHGPRLRLLKGAFESWIWLFGDRVYEARFCPKSSSDEGARADRRGKSSSEGVMADDVAPEGAASPMEKPSVTVCAVCMAFSPTRSMREMANYVRETFIWHWRSASRPPPPLPEDCNVLCPCFSLAEAEAAAAESELPEIIQVIFYAMLLNEMLELGVVHEYTVERMRSLLVGLRWSTFEVWMRIMDEGVQLHHQPDEVEVKGARDG
ncbi:LOW QUALITY PROTEIN: hypothetical protein Cgig2_020949 [Carnegiea gigantea]|uniref:Uncharacterized protein n=1 Tax=Carnegiea gigantea TaxID=171969 RepID=A0A9Q1GLG8_9CARY|nr:LOW QUALITY PROTEIN: hypothetical protein Cgig2_020949 [Carnegiea gigantea]